MWLDHRRRGLSRQAQIVLSRVLYTVSSELALDTWVAEGGVITKIGNPKRGGFTKKSYAQDIPVAMQPRAILQPAICPDKVKLPDEKSGLAGSRPVNERVTFI